MSRDRRSGRRRPALCGLADLLYLRDAGLLAQSAKFLDYEYVPPKPAEPPKRDVRMGRPAPLEYAPAREQPQENTPFWRVVGFESVAPLLGDQRRGRSGDGEREPEDFSPQLEPFAYPKKIPLGSPARLLPHLRRTATRIRPTASPDMRRLLRLIENAEVFAELPRKRRRRWGGDLWTIADYAERLNPYFYDYDELYFILCRLFPEGGLHWSRWRGGAGDPIPPPGCVVLAFTDLGALARADDLKGLPEPMKAWLRYGRSLRVAGCRAVAVLPGTPRRSLEWLAPFWETISLTPRAAPEVLKDWDDTVAQLKVLAAPAIRIEPGLLRALRLLLGPKTDPAMEAEILQGDEISRVQIASASFQAAGRKKLLERFGALPYEQRDAALKIIRSWRPPDKLPNGRSLGVSTVLLEEMSSLDPETSKGLMPNTMRVAFNRALLDLEALQGDNLRHKDILAWVRRFSHRMPDAGWRSFEGQPSQAVLFRLWQAAHAEEKGVAPPPGYAPPATKEARRSLVVHQQSDRLVAGPGGDANTKGSPIVSMTSSAKELAVEPFYDFWKLGAPPSFADRWGCDKTGPWLEFSLEGTDGPVTQRLRWIAPGSFQMGSPTHEAERFKDEGPQHAVTISRGYWLFDTACTQALWTTVMGDNPSAFTGADRPVEGVSWHDACAFVARLNEKIPELALTLPSEAQWEYACRAGTATPFSFGDNITPEQVNYNGEYAYRDAPKGLNRRETVPVASLPANGWGLYEMHGNVWEWCADAWHGNYEGAPIDGSVWDEEDAARRVLRGGSWNDFARYVRSAFRDGYAPAARSGDFGFRCARVQDGAEPAETRRVRQAERRTAAAPSGVAERARIFVGGEGAAIFPRAGPFVIRSDCERVTLEPLTLPPWAKAIGRDRFGLWTRIEIPGPSGVASQKLRWINPGRFLMGSPDGEIDRFRWESPQHEVTISRGFWLFDTACTQALWTAVMGNNPSRFTGADRPVENLSWNDAREFLERINAKIAELGLELPSEAQWEYACRAGTTTPFSFGENITPEQVNYDGNYPYIKAAKGPYRESTVPVGSLPPNLWGLYEMHGNVWEWCADAWHEDYEGAPIDGSVWDEEGAAERVLRGGSWSNYALYVRSAFRFRFAPDVRYDRFGFRCARVQE